MGGEKSIRRNKLSRFFRIMVFTFAVILLCDTVEVRADMGPKPSIELTVVNTSVDYYVALLCDYRETKEPNSELKLQNVTDESVKEYLENFVYDGWTFYESPVGMNIQKYKPDGIYNFTYMVPEYFRVILISADGTVSISEAHSKEEFNAKCTYDVGNGTITEETTHKNAYKLIYIEIFFILTLIVELLVLKAFKYPMVFNNILVFFIANFLTNVPYNIILLFSHAGLPIIIYSFFLEIVIILVEAFIYMKFLKNKEGEKTPKKSFLYSVVANITSAVVGIVIFFMYSMFIK